MCQVFTFFFFFKILFIYFGQRGREGEREGEKHHCVYTSHTPPNWGPDLARSPGMCPDWELNWQPFGNRLALTPLSHTGMGIRCLLFSFSFYSLKFKCEYRYTGSGRTKACLSVVGRIIIWL